MLTLSLTLFSFIHQQQATQEYERQQYENYVKYNKGEKSFCNLSTMFTQDMLLISKYYIHWLYIVLYIPPWAVLWM
jgi:trehalose-6-phosphate synthase